MSLHTCECMIAPGHAWALCAATVQKHAAARKEDKFCYTPCGQPALEKHKTQGYGWIWVCDTCKAYVMGKLTHHPCLRS